MASANTSQYIDPENYCPFGCEKHQLDAYGYCPHLVGFTGQKKKMECVVYDAKGQPKVRGDKIEPVLSTDKLVNPEYVQRDQAGTHMAQKWVSYRVYRDCDEETAEEWRLKYVGVAGEASPEALQPV